MKEYNETELLEAVKDLVAIRSTADNPAALRAAYEYMRELVRSSGKDITIEEFERGGKPSFLAYHGQKRPDNFRIILNGHVDVVPGKPEQYKLTVEGDRLYGRGTYDMKAATVVLAGVFCDYVNKVPYALGLQIVTDEESGGRHGTIYQIQEGVRADFIICGECGRSTTAYEIANEAKGNVLASIGFRGDSAHGAYPWRGDNAALRAVRFTQKVHERFPAPTEETRETTVTVVSIDATSDAHNKTAGSAVAKVDVRYAPDDPSFRTKAHFATLIKEFDPNAEILEFHDFSSPIYTNPDNPLLLRLKASAERVEGAEFSFVRRNGTSDGRFFGEVGDEACEFGIAGEYQHGDNEHITLKGFRNYFETMSDFLEKTISSGHNAEE